MYTCIQDLVVVVVAFIHDEHEIEVHCNQSYYDYAFVKNISFLELDKLSSVFLILFKLGR